MARLGVPVPAPVFMPPHVPVYNNLPAHLAQQLAALPPLKPLNQGRNRPSAATATATAPAPAPASALAPAFEPVLEPVMGYHNLPAHLAQQLAALPPLVQHGRGRGRGRGHNRTVPAFLPFVDIAAQYAALPSVCCILFYGESETS